MPQLTAARKVAAIDGGTVRIERQIDTGYEMVEADLPVVVSVIEKINEPRYPSFKGIMAAKKKPLTTLTVADLGLDPAHVGAAGAYQRGGRIRPAPAAGRRANRQRRG